MQCKDLCRRLNERRAVEYWSHFMPVITLNRNDNADTTKTVLKPGVIVLGKNRNAVRAELEKGESAFRTRFITGAADINENISGLIIIASEDYAEALKYAFLAQARGLPHLLITTAVGGKTSVRFLHIMYTDEESLLHAVAAVTSAEDAKKEQLFSARESFYIYAQSSCENTDEQAAELLAKVLDRMPNYNFGKVYITLHTPMDLSDNKTLQTVCDTLHPIIELVHAEGEEMTADVLCV
jgi:hypothetical protein